MPVDLVRVGADGGAVYPSITGLREGEYLSPWIDAVKTKEGGWALPQYDCEIKGLDPNDPKNKKWTPGEYQDGVDNTDLDEQNQVREWGGQKLWEGDRHPKGWDPKLYSDGVQALLKVPHMPGQPVKEMFARMKALEPRRFQDKHFEEILRDMVPEWPVLHRLVKHAESFGIHTEEEPAEWAGQEDDLVPAAYLNPLHDTVTLCVGTAGHDWSQGPPSPEIPGAEYDNLEYLYAKDQEGKLIQIVAFPNYGYQPTCFNTFSFAPPRGTTAITPFACFKIRGVWKGMSVEWDSTVGSEEMSWFTDMPPELRLHLAEKGLLQPASKAAIAALRVPKAQKALPVLWPENSWEGNAAKARSWDQQQARDGGS